MALQSGSDGELLKKLETPRDQTSLPLGLGLGLPVITPAMLPRPDQDPARQSAEDWFKLFKAVADGLVQLYCSVGQEIIGQRQALATLPALLNRNESERKLTTRILTESESLEQAEELIRLTLET